MKISSYLYAAIIAVHASSTFAHGIGCNTPRWVVNLNVAIGNFCAIWLVVALIYGLFAIRGNLRWQITAKLALVMMFVIFSGWFILINYVGCINESDILFMIVFNFLPAAFFNFIVYWFRKLGANKFA